MKRFRPILKACSWQNGKEIVSHMVMICVCVGVVIIVASLHLRLLPIFLQLVKNDLDCFMVNSDSSRFLWASRRRGPSKPEPHHLRLGFFAWVRVPGAALHCGRPP